MTKCKLTSKTSKTTCYMCDHPATTSEHIPPRCFFPEKKDLPPGLDYRRGCLIKVPSCELHNCSKSKDDEYLLFVIVSYFENNLAAQRHFSTKIIRAIEKRPSLLHLFSDPQPITIDAEPMIRFTVDKDRFDRAFESMARGIYYHHYRQKWMEPVWVFCPSLLSVDGAYSAQINRNVRLANAGTHRFFSDRPRYGDNPDVFHYQIDRREIPPCFALRMVFYQGFTVVAVSNFESS